MFQRFAGGEMTLSIPSSIEDEMRKYRRVNHTKEIENIWSGQDSAGPLLNSEILRDIRKRLEMGKLQLHNNEKVEILQLINAILLLSQSVKVEYWNIGYFCMVSANEEQLHEEERTTVLEMLNNYVYPTLSEEYRHQELDALEFYTEKEHMEYEKFIKYWKVNYAGKIEMGNL
ncbi:hypothetical protein F8161_19775 [Bacillus cereus]|uniref:Uncharacterized protein n=2 Tax=Bacillus cereus group TaxID=86661 RepID=A0A9W7UNT0_BACCE|nr:MULTISPECIES: hypothetical protein [Bacillus cereus group]KAA6449294.1 hypothetical protein DX932_29780 [Bacillus cereus]KAB2425309.1 hypothetical protein F8167_01480 [Bacillus cereus]KAB2439695.1 hypothetical protein F8163_27045 [Bacillus luti]KAB2458663.1 hypothetical protein F8161_19775 [Bacillus cereus]KAB2482969.1 hypothetical protein F8159_06520 [Bacillus cereus]